MANETERFVLQYTTEIRDSLKRLEELQNKVKKTKEVTDSASKGFSEFTEGATDELSKMVPQVGMVTKAVKAMTAEFAVASVAVGALAVGVKAAMMANENLTRQRTMGQQIGMSPGRIEQLTRDFSGNSQGRLNRDQAMEAIKAFGDRVNEARQDLPGTGVRRNFTMNGINVGSVKNHPSLPAMFNEIGGRVQHMDEAKGRALLNQIGLSPDMLGNFQRYGNKTGDRMLSQQETDDRKEAEEAARKVNDELNKINNQFTEMSLILGQKLLPWAEKFTGWMLDITKFVFSDSKTPVANYNTNPYSKPTDKQLAEAQKFGQSNPLQFGVRHPEAVQNVAAPQLIGTSAQERTALEKFTKEQADITAKQQEAQRKEDDIYQEYADATAEQKLAAQMFTTAVATFAHATDMNDALAMWAGAIGAASGLKGANGTQSGPSGAAAIGPYAAASGSQRGGLGATLITSGRAEDITTKGYTHDYDALYNKYGAALGIDPRILKGQGMQESGLNNDSRGNGGGIGQLSPAIQKKYGVTDVLDAEQNIRASAMYMADLLKITDGNMAEALKRYIGGGPNNKKNHGKHTNEYAGKVYARAGLSANDFESTPQTMRSQNDVIPGKGKAGRQVMAAVNSLANYMHIDPGQILGGHTTRGDMEFSMMQLERSLINNHQDLVNKTNAINVPEKEMAAYRQQLKQNEIDQQNLRAFGGNVLDMATEGGRTAETQGLVPVTINVQSNGNDGYAQGKAAAEGFEEHRRNLVRQNASTLKY